MKFSCCCHCSDTVNHSDDKLIFQKLDAHTHPITSIDICEERNLFVTGSNDSTVRIWNLKDNILLKTYQFGNTVTSTVISKQGKFLAYGLYLFGKLGLMDISDLSADPDEIKLKGHLKKRIIMLNFSNDGNYLISSGEDMTIRVWNVQNRQELLKYELGSCPYGVAINSDNTFLSSCSTEGEIKIWNFKSKKLLCRQQGHKGKTRIAFPNNKQILISNGENSVKMWSLKKMNKGQLLLIKIFKFPSEYKGYALLTTDIRFIITYDQRDHYLSVIDSNNGFIIQKSKQYQFNLGYDKIAGISMKMNSLFSFKGIYLIVQKLS